MAHPAHSLPLPGNLKPLFLPRRKIQSKAQAKFILFINVLLKYLESSASPELARQAKLVVKVCIRRNRMQDPNFVPLTQAIAIHVHDCIGTLHWSRANNAFQVYSKGQNLLHMQARGSLLATQLSSALLPNSGLLLPTRQQTPLLAELALSGFLIGYPQI
jgi:hypothetical protein